jgi:hypothetical protein
MGYLVGELLPRSAREVCFGSQTPKLVPNFEDLQPYHHAAGRMR